MIRVCFVCLGNICRSPTAEAVMKALVDAEGLADQITVDSAGTNGWHVGEPPDRRSAAEAERRGIPMCGTARRFEAWDFEDFDLVIAMDERNQSDLVDLAPDEASAARVHLLREFDPDHDPGEPTPDVPDPYQGGPDGFVAVFDMVDAACRGLLAELRRES